MKVRVLFIELCISKVVFCILVSKMVSILCTGSNVKRYKRLGYDAKIDERYGINGVMTSSEQIYLWKLYGGEINAPMFGYLADILFEDEHIYIEYSGSGHNIRITYNKMTQEEFDEHEELRRKVFLDNGYKEFEIISKTDKLPNDNYLYKIKNEAFTKLKESNCVYYGINIDTGEKFYK